MAFRHRLQLGDEDMESDDAESRERAERYQRNSGYIVSRLIPRSRRDIRSLNGGNDRTARTLGRDNSMTSTVLSLGNLGTKGTYLHELVRLGFGRI